jgi:two-component system, chemotaxis family, sensor kinase CheA
MQDGRMDKKDEAFLNKLLATFKVEATEHLSAITRGLIYIEKPSGKESRAEAVENVFREAHSMKGAARSVNITDIESLCQSLENVFAAMKKKEISPAQEDFDALHRTVDFLVERLSSFRVQPVPEQKAAMKVLVNELEALSKGRPGMGSSEKKRAPGGEYSFSGEEKTSTAGPGEGKQPASATVRISAEKLGSVLLQSEEFVSEKLAAGRRAAELREVSRLVEKRETEWRKLRPGMRAAARTLERTWKDRLPAGDAAGIMKLLDFLESNGEFVTMLHSMMAAMEKASERDRRAIGLMVDSLNETMKSVLMVPFSTLLDLLPKLVRDISHAQGKEAELVAQGSEMEIDRRVLDEMKDPLIHLLRNCLDHGIERPEVREKKGKPRFGTISLSFANAENRRVALTISDDGAGIDFGKVRDSAVKTGLFSTEEAGALGDLEAIDLVFRSGISTSPIITDLSGRGLGLAIVKERVNRLNGTISCKSQMGKGTTFRIELPLTLAAFRGVAVRVDDHLFIIPTLNLDRTVRVAREEVRTLENREMIAIEGMTIPLVPLHAVLELPQTEKKSEGEFLHAAVLSAAEKRIAFSVDEVVNEEEVLVKGLGPQLSRVRNISGATVLGNGRVVPILNVSDLMKSAVKAGGPAVKTVKEQAGPAKTVLVVEDSITARTLLKNILEASGYQVRTAVDGVDAYTLLRTEAVDIVVSDVDMPRMNGFDLTAKIRSEAKFADLPVILVTALESRGDKERGVDVGANAYIIKSSFDQSNLLEALKRLI